MHFWINTAPAFFFKKKQKNFITLQHFYLKKKKKIKSHILSCLLWLFMWNHHVFFLSNNIDNDNKQLGNMPLNFPRRLQISSCDQAAEGDNTQKCALSRLLHTWIITGDWFPRHRQMLTSDPPSVTQSKLWQSWWFTSSTNLVKISLLLLTARLVLREVFCFVFVLQCQKNGWHD